MLNHHRNVLNAFQHPQNTSDLMYWPVVWDPKFKYISVSQMLHYPQHTILKGWWCLSWLTLMSTLGHHLFFLPMMISQTMVLRLKNDGQHFLQTRRTSSVTRKARNIIRRPEQPGLYIDMYTYAHICVYIYIHIWACPKIVFQKRCFQKSSYPVWLYLHK